MPNLIASRISNYLKFRDRGWAHLPTIGIHHVEVNVPKDAAEQTQLAQNVKANKLHVSSMQGTFDVTSPQVKEQMQRQLEVCRLFACQRLFLSVKAGETPRELVWDRLRQLGDLAARHDVIAVLETHPDLITNGSIARATMQAVDHPHVRVNFDTANVYYYNHDVTTMSELEQVIDYVAAIHLKDTNGKFHDHEFPGLGDGVVDFPAVFAAMGARGFTGPYTMELEGGFMAQFDEPQVQQFITGCVMYLRKIGAMS